MPFFQFAHATQALRQCSPRLPSFVFFIGGKSSNHHFRLARYFSADHRCNGHVPGIEGQINGACSLRRRG